MSSCDLGPLQVIIFYSGYKIFKPIKLETGEKSSVAFKDDASGILIDAITERMVMTGGGDESHHYK